MKIKILGLAILSLGWIGCASTTLSSFNDPAYLKREYPAFIIYAPFTDLESMTIAEQAFGDKAASRDVACTNGSTVVPPTRTMSSVEINDAFVQSKVPAVLQLDITEEGEDTTITPPSWSFGSSTSKEHGKKEKQSWMSFTPGEIITKPRMRVSLRLIDVQSNQVAWIGTAHTEGSRWATFSTMMYSLAGEAMDQLIDGKMIHPVR